MLSWFHFSSRPFPVSSKHLTHVTRPRLHTALTHGNPVSRISRSRFTRAASGRTSKTSWFGCSHPLTAVLWKPVLIFYSFRSLPFPVLYSLCKFQIFVKGFLARNRFLILRERFICRISSGEFLHAALDGILWLASLPFKLLGAL